MQSFSLNRFKNLLIRQLTNQRKQYLFGALGILGGFTVANAASQGTLSYSINTFVPMFWIIWTGALAFVEYDEKHKRTFQINLPATQLEKFLTEIVSTFVILPIALFVSFTLAMFLGTLISPIFHDPACVQPFSFSNIINSINHDISSILAFLNILVTFFLGAIYFKKQKFLKTLAALFAYGMILITIFFIIVSARLDETATIISPNNFLFHIPSWAVLCSFILWFVFYLWLTYQRLKEQKA